MQPEIDLGPLDLKTFGICFALGFLAAGAVIARRLRELDKPVDWAYEMVFAALVGGLVGSRVDFILQNWDDVSGDLLGNVFSGSGLVWQGGAIGGAIGVLLWAWWRGWLGPRAARHLRRAAGARLCDRSHRLPAVGRRRLRRRVRPALGDGLPGRHRADRPGGASDADLRDARDGPRRARALAPARPGRARRDVRPLPRARRRRAAAGRVHPPQRQRRRRPHARAAGQRRDDGRRRRDAAARCAPHARPRGRPAPLRRRGRRAPRRR